MADVDLRLYADQFIRGITQTNSSITSLSKNLASITKVTTDYNKQTGVARVRIEGITEGGKKARIEFAKLNGQIKQIKSSYTALARTQNQTTAASKKQEAQIKRQTAARAKQTRELRGFIRQQENARRRQLSTAPTREEQARFVEAQRALLRLTEAGKLTAAQAKTIFRNYEAGSLRATKTTDGLRGTVIRLFNSVRGLGAAEDRRAKKKQAQDEAERKRAEKRLAQRRREIALIREAQGIRQITRGSLDASTRARLDAGILPTAATQNYLRAEAALQKLGRTGKVTGGDIQSALRRAQAGTLTYANATTTAEKATLRFVAAQKQLSASTSTSFRAVQRLTAAIVDMGRLIGISLLIGSAFRLQQAIEDAASAAIELDRRIAEIRTIEVENAALATEEWVNELRQLSDAFGIPAIQQAEAAYQTLSNQVAQGAEAIRFLDAANRLAVTGVTDTASAVNLLTSVINAFKLPVDEAEVISAKLFKTVELGRVRIEEMGTSFGRVAVPANQLGISLDELLASISLVTIQGVRFNEASTLIRNVILKLIRPTGTMSGIFRDLGVSSGEALIAQRGLIGTLQAIEQAVGGTSTELGEAFGRIRAITGALIFSKDNAALYAEQLGKIEEQSVKAFREDTARIIQSTGQQLQIAGEQAKNFFQVEIGRPAIKAILDLIKRLGGVNNILETFIKTVKETATVIASALIARNIAVFYNAFVVGSIAARAQLRLLRRTARATAASIEAAFSTIVIFAFVEALLYARNEFIRAQEELKRAAEEANLALIKGREDALRDAEARVEEETRSIRKALKERESLVLGGIALRRRALAQEQDAQQRASDETSRRAKLAIQDFNKALTRQISGQKKLYNEATKDAQDAADDIQKIFREIRGTQVTTELIGTGVGQQLQVLAAEIEEFQKRAQRAVAAGDLEAFQEATKRVNELTKQRTEAQVQLQNAQIRLDRDLAESRARLVRSRSVEERQAAEQTIKSLERQQRVLFGGSAAQLDAEKRLQELQTQLLRAESAEEIKDIYAEIAKVKKEQELIEESVAREQKTRLANLKLQRQQTAQLEEIRRKNEQEAAAAAERQRRLEVAQFLYKALTNEANAFQQAKVLEGNDQNKINAAVTRQQDLFAKIIALQRELGGGAEAERLVREKSLRLQEATNLRIAAIREEALQKQTTEVGKIVSDQLDAAVRFRAETGKSLDLFEQRLQAIGQELTSVFATELPATTTSELVKFDTQVKTLLQALQRQRATPTDSGAAKLEQSLKIFSQTAEKLLIQPTGDFGGISGFGDFSGDVEEVRVSLAGLSKSLQKTVAEAFQPEEFGRLRQLIEQERAQRAAESALEDQIKAIEASTDARTEEQKQLDRSKEAANTHADALYKATQAIEQLRGISETTPEAGRAPGLPQIPRVTDLTSRIVEDAFEEGGKRGIEGALQRGASSIFNAIKNAGKAGFEQAAEAARPGIEETEREAAKANTEQKIEDAPRVADAQVTAEQERRARARARLGPFPFETRRRDTPTIQLGRGAPSVAAQQAAIRQQLEAQAQQQQAARRARRENERLERERRRQEAVLEGRLFAGAGGLVARRGAGVGRQVAPGPGRQVGPRPGEFAVRESGEIKGGIEENVKQTKRAADLLQQIRDTQGDTLSTDVNELNRLMGGQFTRPSGGEEAAKEALRDAQGPQQRATDTASIQDRIRDAAQRLADAQERQIQLETRIAEERERSGAASNATSATLNAAKLAEAQARRELAEAQRELKERIEFEARLGTFQGRQPFRAYANGGLVDSVPAMLTPGEFVMNRQSTQRFLPQLLSMNAGRLRPRGYDDGGLVTNVGGINIRVTEASNAQATGREVARVLQREIRRGTVTLGR